MQVYDFFSGIGGFSLAAEWMGWDVRSFCEIDPYCQRVLAKHWPNVYIHDDIKTYEYATYEMVRGRGPVLFAGGFPCQPFSQAGKRKGIADDRNLWPEYFRIIREARPDYVVGENVANLTSMEDGQVFDGILSDLEGEGYQVESYLIPACGVEAWHRRERLWIVGHATGTRLPQPKAGVVEVPLSHAERTGLQESSGDHPDTPRAHTNGFRPRRKKKHQHGGTQQRRTKLRHQQKREPGSMGEDVPDSSGGRHRSQDPEVQARWHSTFDGSVWQTEPRVDRVADGVPRRVDLIKGLGNAVVPQVVYQLFKAIQHHENNN